jgi:hypothetical protein
MTNIASIKANDKSEKIFSLLKNKKFFAISLEKNGKMVLHQNKISNEEIVYASNFVIASIINPDLIK